MANHYEYHIIDRQGNLVYSDTGVYSLVSHDGIFLGNNKGNAFIYNPLNNCKINLPSVIDNKETLFYPALHPQSGLIIGYNIGASKRYKDANGLPPGKNIVSSFVLDANANLLFNPIPLFLYDFGHDWFIAFNRKKNLYLLNLKGEIIHSYPKDLRLKYYYLDNKCNIIDIIAYKDSDKGKVKLPLYHIDVLTGCIHGPYLYISRLQEGLREVTTMEGEILFLDQDWNEVLSFAHLQKKKDIMVTRYCTHGHICILICNEGKCLLYNRYGQVVIGAKYSDFIHVKDDIWFYEKRGKLGLIHESGEIITPPQFYNIGLSIYEFSHGMIPVGTKTSQNKKIRWGYINQQGEWVIPPQFNSAFSFFHPNFATVEGDPTPLHR